MKTKVRAESKIFRKKKPSQTKSSSTFPNKTIEIGGKKIIEKSEWTRERVLMNAKKDQ